MKTSDTPRSPNILRAQDFSANSMRAGVGTSPFTSQAKKSNVLPGAHEQAIHYSLLPNNQAPIRITGDKSNPTQKENILDSNTILSDQKNVLKTRLFKNNDSSPLPNSSKMLTPKNGGFQDSPDKQVSPLQKLKNSYNGPKRIEYSRLSQVALTGLHRCSTEKVVVTDTKYSLIKKDRIVERLGQFNYDHSVYNPIFITNIIMKNDIKSSEELLSYLRRDERFLNMEIGGKMLKDFQNSEFIRQVDFDELVKASVNQSIQLLKANGVRVQTNEQVGQNGQFAEQFKRSFLNLDDMKSQSEIAQVAPQRFTFKIHPAQINQDHNSIQSITGMNFTPELQTSPEAWKGKVEGPSANYIAKELIDDQDKSRQVSDKSGNHLGHVIVSADFNDWIEKGDFHQIEQSSRRALRFHQNCALPTGLSQINEVTEHGSVQNCLSPHRDITNSLVQNNFRSLMKRTLSHERTISSNQVYPQSSMLSQKPQVSIGNFTAQDDSVSPKSMSLLPIFGAEILQNQNQQKESANKIYQNPLRNFGSSLGLAAGSNDRTQTSIVPQGKTEDTLLPAMTPQGQLNFLGSAMIQFQSLIPNNKSYDQKTLQAGPAPQINRSSVRKGELVTDDEECSKNFNPNLTNKDMMHDIEYPQRDEWTSLYSNFQSSKEIKNEATSDYLARSNLTNPIHIHSTSTQRLQPSQNAAFETFSKQNEAVQTSTIELNANIPCDTSTFKVECNHFIYIPPKSQPSGNQQQNKVQAYVIEQLTAKKTESQSENYISPYVTSKVVDTIMQSREFQTLASGSNIIVDVAQNLELPDSYRINVTLEDISTGSNNHPHQLSKINKFANEFNARIEEHSEESDSVSNEVSDQSLDENLEIEQDINQKTLSSLKKECQTNTGIEYIQNALAQDHQSPYLFKNGQYRTESEGDTFKERVAGCQEADENPQLETNNEHYATETESSPFNHNNSSKSSPRQNHPLNRDYPGLISSKRHDASENLEAIVVNPKEDSRGNHYPQMEKIFQVNTTTNDLNHRTPNKMAQQGTHMNTPGFIFPSEDTSSNVKEKFEDDINSDQQIRTVKKDELIELSRRNDLRSLATSSLEIEKDDLTNSKKQNISGKKYGQRQHDNFKESNMEIIDEDSAESDIKTIMTPINDSLLTDSAMNFALKSQVENQEEKSAGKFKSVTQPSLSAIDDKQEILELRQKPLPHQIQKKVVEIEDFIERSVKKSHVVSKHHPIAEAENESSSKSLTDNPQEANEPNHEEKDDSDVVIDFEVGVMSQHPAGDSMLLQQVSQEKKLNISSLAVSKEISASMMNQQVSRKISHRTQGSITLEKSGLDSTDPAKEFLTSGVQDENLRLGSKNDSKVHSNLNSTKKSTKSKSQKKNDLQKELKRVFKEDTLMVSNLSQNHSNNGDSGMEASRQVKKELFNEFNKASRSGKSRDKSASSQRPVKKYLNKQEEVAMIDRLTGQVEPSYISNLVERESYKALSKNTRKANRDVTSTSKHRSQSKKSQKSMKSRQKSITKLGSELKQFGINLPVASKKLAEKHSGDSSSASITTTKVERNPQDHSKKGSVTMRVGDSSFVNSQNPSLKSIKQFGRGEVTSKHTSKNSLHGQSKSSRSTLGRKKSNKGIPNLPIKTNSQLGTRKSFVQDQDQIEVDQHEFSDPHTERIDHSRHNSYYPQSVKTQQELKEESALRDQILNEFIGSLCNTGVLDEKDCENENFFLDNEAIVINYQELVAICDDIGFLSPGFIFKSNVYKE